jgi:hypothetical protein
MKFLASALLALLFVTVESTLGQESTQDHPALESEKTSQTKNIDAEHILREFKSYYVRSDTIYLHRETLQKELQNRPEFPAWELTATEDSKAADVVITITLPFLTWEWNYRIVSQPTGTVLGTGKVSAAVEKTAAPQLATMIVKRIREVRPLPASFQDTARTAQALANSRPEKGKSWRVRYISGPVSGLRKDTPVILTVTGEWIIVRASKTRSFSIPRNVTTADSRTEVHKATKGWEEFWDSQCCGDSGGAALLIAPVFLVGEGILAPIKTTDHFVSMYWLEDGAAKRAEFRANGGDTKSLLAELKKVTGRNAEDLQELADRRQKLIKEQYDHSPIIEINQQVNIIGWYALSPGQYHLIVVPRENNLAEVHFFPANKPAPNFESGIVNEEDVGTLAVAELERRKTPLESKAAPSVSYREQNGLVTFSQIDTDDLILRFTPIPLGFAK